jgi:hypothetical protein
LTCAAANSSTGFAGEAAVVGAVLFVVGAVSVQEMIIRLRAIHAKAIAISFMKCSPVF